MSGDPYRQSKYELGNIKFRHEAKYNVYRNKQFTASNHPIYDYYKYQMDKTPLDSYEKIIIKTNPRKDVRSDEKLPKLYEKTISFAKYKPHDTLNTLEHKILTNCFKKTN